MQSPSVADVRPPRIVDDLIPIILENNDHWWPRDFQRLAVVSSAWVAPVRKCLYTRPILSMFRACHLFVRALTENPSLRSFVQGVDLCPVPDDTVCHGIIEKMMAHVRFILGLQGIRSVKLGGALAVSAERFIDAVTSSNTIVDLCIDGSALRTFCLFSGPPLLWDGILASKFTSLRTLRLSCVEFTVPPLPTSYPMPLTELYLENVDITGNLPVDLCQGPWYTLRTLGVRAKSAVGNDYHIRCMIQRCVNLETLRYEVRDTHGHGAIFDHESPPRHSLRQLLLSGLDVTPQSLDDIALCCRNLEELTVLGHLVRISSTDWASWLASDTLPALRALRTPHCTTSPPFLYWSDDMIRHVQVACSARNIVFCC
ncbi:hypothetical protein BKA93DRAFT_898317 [Sparassis latifolia]